MHLSLLTLVLLAGQSPQTLFVADIKASGLDDAQVTLIDTLVGESVKKHSSVNVVTRKDIERKIQLESDKELAGCDYESCVSELAGALGADFFITATWASLGGEEILQMNIFSNAKSEPLKRVSRALDSKNIREQIEASVVDLLTVLPEKEFPPTLVEEVKPANNGLWYGGAASAGLLSLVSLGAATYFGISLLDDKRTKDERELSRGGLYVMTVATPLFLVAAAALLIPTFGGE